MGVITHIGQQEEGQVENSVQLRAADPGSPVSNQIWVNTTDDVLRYYNGSSTITIGGSGSTSTVAINNFYSKGDGENSVVGDFSTGNNATFDGGGTLAGTFSITTTASDLINGAQSFKYVGSATAGNNTDDYIASEIIDIPAGYRGRNIGIKLQYRTSNYTDGNIAFRVKDTTNAAILTDDTITLDAYADATDDTAAEFRMNFFCPRDCTQIEVGPHVLTGEVSTTLVWDDVVISDDLLLSINLDNMTDWTAFTPTGGWTTNVTYTGKYRRVGDSAHIIVDLEFTGATDSGIKNINVLPPGMLLDQTKLLLVGTALSETGVGTTTLSHQGSIGDPSAAIFISGSSIRPRYNTSSGGATTNLTSVAPVTIASGHHITVDIIIPVLGWSSKAEHIVTPLENVKPVRYANSDDTAIADSTVTFIGFDSLDFDDDSLIKNAGSANNTAHASTTYYECPSNGKYEVSGQIYWNDADLDADEWREIGIAVNGTATSLNFTRVEGTLTNGQFAHAIHDFVNAIKGDKISLQANHNAGAAATLYGAGGYSHLSIKKIDQNATLGAFPNSPAMIRLETGNGHGSTNTTIRRFSTLLRSVGNAITYTDSATAGASFTANEAGTYSLTYTDTSSTINQQFGFSLNSSQLTTGMNAITSSTRVAHSQVFVANTFGCANATIYLDAGDVIRPHTMGSGFTTSTQVNFIMAKVS